MTLVAIVVDAWRAYPADYAARLVAMTSRGIAASDARRYADETPSAAGQPCKRGQRADRTKCKPKGSKGVNRAASRGEQWAKDHLSEKDKATREKRSKAMKARHTAKREGIAAEVDRKKDPAVAQDDPHARSLAPTSAEMDKARTNLASLLRSERGLSPSKVSDRAHAAVGEATANWHTARAAELAAGARVSEHNRRTTDPGRVNPYVKALRAAHRTADQAATAIRQAEAWRIAAGERAERGTR